MKQGMTLPEMAQKIQTSSEMKQDYVVKMENVDFGISSTGKMEYYAGVPGHGGIGGQISRHAFFQTGAELGVPSRFISLLLDEDKAYLPELFNRRAHQNGRERMLRTVDSKMVANVSPSFSRDYDNDLILKAALPILMDSELKVESANLSDTHMRLKVVSEKLKGEVRIGDIVQGGISLGNSDVGCGRAFIQELMFRLWCLNGSAHGEVSEAYARVHRGARQPMGILYAPETIAAHQEAIALEMRDTIGHILSEENFARITGKMQAAASNEITANDLDAKVKELGRTVGFNQTEGDQILAYLIEGGDLTQYGMFNAVTRYAQDVDSYDRASDLEVVGGKVLELKPRQWENVRLAA